MAQTAAERQATYRDKKKYEVDEQGYELGNLNVYISKPHRAILAELSKRHGVTVGKIVSQMIEQSPLTRALESEKDEFLSGAASGNSTES